MLNWQALSRSPKSKVKVKVDDWVSLKLHFSTTHPHSTHLPPPTHPRESLKKYTAIYPKLKVLVYVRGFWNMFWNRPRPKNYPMEVKCQKLFYSIYEFSNSEFSILNFQIRNVQFRSFKFLIFSCDQQLKEWPCHSVSSFERLFVSLFWFVSFIAVRRIICQATFLKRIIDSSEAWLSILLAC